MIDYEVGPPVTKQREVVGQHSELHDERSNTRTKNVSSAVNGSVTIAENSINWAKLDFLTIFYDFLGNEVGGGARDD